MPRKPNPLFPLSPHGIRVAVVKRLITPQSLAQKGAFGRELVFLRRLQARFNDDAFWLQLSPAVPLDSLGWFFSEYGASALKKEYDLYLYAKAQDQVALDSAASRRMIEDTPQEEWRDSPRQVARKSSVAWADGE